MGPEKGGLVFNIEELQDYLDDWYFRDINTAENFIWYAISNHYETFEKIFMRHESAFSGEKKLKPINDYIKLLQAPTSAIGETTLIGNKGNKDATAYILQVTDNKYEVCFLDKHKHAQKKLGEISFFRIKPTDDLKNEKVYSEQHRKELNNHHPVAGYSGENNNNKAVSKIYISLMESYNKQYAGIGTSLMQAAIETSFHTQCAGRVSLSAAWSSHIFHYKMHLRAASGNKRRDKMDNNELKSLAKEQDKNKSRVRTDDFGSIEMCLPERSIKKWNQVITKSPVLYQTKKIQLTIFSSKKAGILMGVRHDFENQTKDFRKT